MLLLLLLYHVFLLSSGAAVVVVALCWTPFSFLLVSAMHKDNYERRVDIFFYIINKISPSHHLIL